MNYKTFLPSFIWPRVCCSSCAARAQFARYIAAWQLFWHGGYGHRRCTTLALLDSQGSDVWFTIVAALPLAASLVQRLPAALP